MDLGHMESWNGRLGLTDGEMFCGSLSNEWARTAGRSSRRKTTRDIMVLAGEILELVYGS